ncbi:MAG TPA: hypothetical protein ENJ49_01460, partial [Candidatus Moranbacteria bacterium]|nr:hypothetical protein [Candidatus Moranbacteria bacterium]
MKIKIRKKEKEMKGGNFCVVVNNSKEKRIPDFLLDEIIRNIQQLELVLRAGNIPLDVFLRGSDCREFLRKYFPILADDYGWD